jgi:hypothetical protein
MSGFNELIPQELINVFDERELEVSCLRTGAVSVERSRSRVVVAVVDWRNVRDRRRRLDEAHRLPRIVS